jgi:hypothetical protein
VQPHGQRLHTGQQVGRTARSTFSSPYSQAARLAGAAIPCPEPSPGRPSPQPALVPSRPLTIPFNQGQRPPTWLACLLGASPERACPCVSWSDCHAPETPTGLLDLVKGDPMPVCGDTRCEWLGSRCATLAGRAWAVLRPVKSSAETGRSHALRGTVPITAPC